MEFLASLWQQFPLWLKWGAGIAGTVILGSIGSSFNEHFVSPWTWKFRASRSRRAAERIKKNLEERYREIEFYYENKNDLILRSIQHLFSALGFLGLSTSLFLLGSYLLTLGSTQPGWEGVGLLVGLIIMLIAMMGGVYFLLREFGRMLDTSLVIKNVLGFSVYRVKVEARLDALTGVIEGTHTKTTPSLKSE